ncbi:Translation initiation factor IF-2 [Frankliniella fusca]|uniref:Translation initiation factor IF-2 n=1 Tax=Frankliniella fusca TaxID=407009 RepID=A0AAE1GWR7_9NEOP|nr:Translation initiation factor IF-2 [Frankliniella fusca]
MSQRVQVTALFLDLHELVLWVARMALRPNAVPNIMHEAVMSELEQTQLRINLDDPQAHLPLHQVDYVVEQAFSTMNAIKIKSRNRMGVELLVSIMRIRLRLRLRGGKKCCREFEPSQKMMDMISAEIKKSMTAIGVENAKEGKEQVITASQVGPEEKRRCGKIKVSDVQHHSNKGSTVSLNDSKISSVCDVTSNNEDSTVSLDLIEEDSQIEIIIESKQPSCNTQMSNSNEILKMKLPETKNEADVQPYTNELLHECVVDEEFGKDQTSQIKIITESKQPSCDTQMSNSNEILKRKLPETKNEGDVQPYTNELLHECVAKLNIYLLTGKLCITVEFVS